MENRRYIFKEYYNYPTYYIKNYVTTNEKLWIFINVFTIAILPAYLKTFKKGDSHDIIWKQVFCEHILNDELEQIMLGDKLARFVLDISRISGKIDDLNYKLDICDNLGFFQKFIDEDNYLLVTKKFGPKKFVEAFLYRLFYGKEMDNNYTEDNLKGNKSLTQKYKNDFKIVQRSESHYSYEFAIIP